MKQLNQFHYSNVQKYKHGTTKKLHKVIIQNGKGHKAVSHYKKGKHIRTIKKKLNPNEVRMIKNNKFIPGLFSDCKYTNYSLAK